MLKIYGCYRSRASRNIWLAKEPGIPFEVVPVIQANRLKDPNAPGVPLHSRSPEFLKINPNGHIPSADDGGVIIHESLAINLYLAKKHGGPLAPKDVLEDGQTTMWSIWAITEVEGHGLTVMYNMAARPPEQRDAAAAQTAVAALRAPFKVLDDALAKSEWLVGGRFTVADINVAEIVRYATPATALFDDAPRVKAWLAACQGRPAYKEMMATRDKEPA